DPERQQKKTDQHAGANPAETNCGIGFTAFFGRWRHCCVNPAFLFGLWCYFSLPCRKWSGDCSL
ncbi:hypothetical protein ACTVMJ_17145, partial [Serratia marcescens]